MNQKNNSISIITYCLAAHPPTYSTTHLLTHLTTSPTDENPVPSASSDLLSPSGSSYSHSV